MAATQWRADSPLIDQLRHAPQRFDFFQALRILEIHARERAAAAGARAPPPLGGGRRMEDDPIRIRGVATHVFPPAVVHETAIPANHDGSPTRAAAFSDGRSSARGRFELTTAAFGLIGPQGVLPPAFTQDVILDVRERDFRVRDFFDLILHRSATFLFQAWEKYRLPFVIERSRRAGAGDSLERDADDCFTRVLSSLIGMGTPGLRHREELNEDVLLRNAPHFARRSRSASGLAAVLTEAVHRSAAVEQFQGQWLPLEEAAQTRLSTAHSTHFGNCRLGGGLVVGDRAWGVENKLCVRLGPLTYEEFRSFLPDGPRFLPTLECVRAYVGADFEVSLRLVLAADEAPSLLLSCDNRRVDDESHPADVESRLGWNSWLSSEPRHANAEDAVFVDDTTICQITVTPL